MSFLFFKYNLLKKSNTRHCICLPVNMNYLFIQYVLIIHITGTASGT